jgi:hypothetical protein
MEPQMTDQQRLLLSLMVKQHNVTDQTDLIRQLKHSDRIMAEVEAMRAILAKYPSPLPARGELLDAARAECADAAAFLFANYTDIFVRVLKGNLDIDILREIIGYLKKIEDGEVDQHEASYQIGHLLKRMYVDSAVKQVVKNDLEEEKEKEAANAGAITAPAKPQLKAQPALTWKAYKGRLYHNANNEARLNATKIRK